MISRLNEKDTDVSTGGYVILAGFRTHEGKSEAFTNRMRDAAMAVRGGDGVRQFEFHCAADAPNEFLLYEEFDSQTAWETHRDSHEMIELRAAIEPMIADKQRSVWTQVAGFVNKESSPGHSTAVKFRMLASSVEPMLAEMERDVASAEGMLRFDLNEQEMDPGAFLICPRWADRASWQAHQSRPDYLAFRERTAGFYATKPDRTLWRPLR